MRENFFPMRSYRDRPLIINKWDVDQACPQIAMMMEMAKSQVEFKGKRKQNPSTYFLLFFS